MEEYFKWRPTLSLNTDSLLSLNEKFALNKALKNLHKRYMQGHVAIYPGIGYPGVSYSHERAKQIWHTLEPNYISSNSWAADRLNLKIEPISVGGFDTHFKQAQRHEKALLELDQKIGQLGKGAHCLIYSEMGRSLLENDEEGTDHGHNNIAFIIGENVRGGVYGDYVLSEDEYSIDFRILFSEIESLRIGRCV